MKNLRKNLLIFSLALTTVFTSSFTVPVFATSEITSTENTEITSSEASENTETTETIPTPEVTPTPTPEVNNTVITITAKNLDTEQRIDTALFSIKDNNGNLLTFAKTSDGEYQYTTSGTLKALEVDYRGKVKITNMPKGSYAVVDGGTENKYVCNGSIKFVISSLNDVIDLPMEYVSNAGTLSLTFLDQDDNSVIEKGRFVLKDSTGKIIAITNIGKGSYEFSKTDSEAGEFITNAAGKVTVTNLPSGTYKLEQVYAPLKYNSGYITQDVTINAKEITNVTIYNSKKYGDLTVKISSSLDSSKLTGYEFKIADANGYAVPVFKNSDNVYYFNRNGENTTIKVESPLDLNIIGLPEGTYTLHQSKGISDYEDLEDVKFTVKNGKETTITVTSKRALGDLTIIKKDKDSNELLEGFKINVLDIVTAKPLSFIKNKDGSYSYTTQENNVETDLITNKDGKIILKDIPTGLVNIKEIAATEGYIYSREIVEQTISADIETIYESTTIKSNCLLEFINTNGEPIEGVAIKITNAKDEVVINSKSDKNGFLLMSNISAGTYIYEIIGIPSTYTLPQLKAEFTVNNEGIASGLEPITINYNKLSVELKGLEKEDKSGIEFILIDKNKNEIKALTNVDGIATFEKIPFGTYTIKQSKTIDGYELAGEIYENIIIDETYENVKNNYEFNTKLASVPSTEEIEENKKDAEKLSYIIIVLIIIIVAASVAIVITIVKINNDKKKAKNKSNKKDESKKEVKKDTSTKEADTKPTEEVEISEPIIIDESVEESIIETTTKILAEEVTKISVAEDLNERKPSNTNSDPIDPFN